MIDGGPSGEGKLIVLTAPLTETIDHAGYFIQMALASMPKLIECLPMLFGAVVPGSVAVRGGMGAGQGRSVRRAVTKTSFVSHSNMAGRPRSATAMPPAPSGPTCDSNGISCRRGACLNQSVVAPPAPRHR